MDSPETWFHLNDSVTAVSFFRFKCQTGFVLLRRNFFGATNIGRSGKSANEKSPNLQRGACGSSLSVTAKRTFSGY